MANLNADTACGDVNIPDLMIICRKMWNECNRGEIPLWRSDIVVMVLKLVGFNCHGVVALKKGDLRRFDTTYTEYVRFASHVASGVWYTTISVTIEPEGDSNVGIGRFYRTIANNGEAIPAIAGLFAEMDEHINTSRAY